MQYISGGRIIGGEDGDHVKFPFMVSIQRLREGVMWRQHCGGSIVSATAVLTACHCVNEYVKMTPFVLLDPKVLRVVAGVGDVSQQSPNRQDILATRLVPHAQCKNTNEAPYFSDSALLILQTPLVFNTEVQPLKVFSNDPNTASAELQNLLNKEASCTIAGWGRSVMDQKDYGTKLQIADVKLMTTQKCQTTFCLLGATKYCRRDFSKLKQFCAIGSKNASICFADSGGPVICNGFVFGTISYGTVKCPVDWPGVYSNVEIILQLVNTYGKAPTSGYTVGSRRLNVKKSTRSRTKSKFRVKS